jgi:DNA-binding LacI/PurR family transcriptional regulator
MARASNRVTLVDVAAAAGVSLSTASLAFGEGKPIATATRDRVLAAAEELGYHGPDPRGRSLRSGRTSVIGVMIDDSVGRAFRDPVIIGILDGVSEAVAGTSISVLLIPDSAPVTQLRSTAVDAVVAAGCSGHLPVLREVMATREVPVVSAGNQVDGLGCVGVENVAASYELARHLADLGHREVAVIVLPAGTVETARSTGTAQVFPHARRAHAAGSTIDEGRRTAAELLAAEPRPTAIIAQSDLLAVGAIAAAAARGLRVPEDLSVVGFDGIRVDGFTERTLTTIAQPITEMGRLAARAALEAVDGAPVPCRELPVTLVLGDTTAPPPAVPSPAAPSSAVPQPRPASRVDDQHSAAT